VRELQQEKLAAEATSDRAVAKERGRLARQQELLDSRMGSARELQVSMEEGEEMGWERDGLGEEMGWGRDGLGERVILKLRRFMELFVGRCGQGC
jgi:hypothetical protein